MIRNLNPVAFRGFGTILSERVHSGSGSQKGELLTLNPGKAPIYLAKSKVWIQCGTGSAILSVCADGENYLHFYLDKAVCVHENVLFSLSPFQGEASVYLRTDVQPEQTGSRQGDSLRVEHQLQVTGLYTFFYQEKEPGFLFPGEAHSMPELTYVDQGELHSVADGQDQLLKQGDLVVYAPNQWHMQYSDVEVAPRFVTISFDADGSLTPLFNRKFSAPRAATTLLRQMLREQEQTDPYSNDVIISQLTLVLISLLRESDKPTTARLQTSNAIHSENEIIRRAQQYISANIRSKLSVPLVAKEVDVSPSYLTALFHKNLQISPGEYIRRIKLQESKQMIRENNLNFTEIAAELQYSTVHHFSRQFKEKFGITPSEYAKSVK